MKNSACPHLKFALGYQAKTSEFIISATNLDYAYVTLEEYDFPGVEFTMS